MTCPHCIKARDHHGYMLADAACTGCAARAIARGHWFRLSQDAGRQLPEYRALLDRCGVTHEAVKEAT